MVGNSIVPILPYINADFLAAINPIYKGVALSGVKPEDIFSSFARHIGIGAIAMAGIIGIIRSLHRRQTLWLPLLTRSFRVGGASWVLYGIGAIIALILTFCKIPALAFALGMFISFQLNIPLLVGGCINWYVSTRSKDKALNLARQEKGTLLASGFPEAH